MLAGIFRRSPAVCDPSRDFLGREKTLEPTVEQTQKTGALGRTLGHHGGQIGNDAVNQSALVEHLQHHFQIAVFLGRPCLHPELMDQLHRHLQIQHCHPAALQNQHPKVEPRHCPQRSLPAKKISADPLVFLVLQLQVQPVIELQHPPLTARREVLVQTGTQTDDVVKVSADRFPQF